MDVGSKVLPSRDKGLDSQQQLPKTVLLVSSKEHDSEPREAASSKKAPQSSRIDGESKDDKSTSSKYSFSLINSQSMCVYFALAKVNMQFKSYILAPIKSSQG